MCTFQLSRIKDSIYSFYDILHLQGRNRKNPISRILDVQISNFVSLFLNKAFMMNIVLITISFILHRRLQKRKHVEPKAKLRYPMVKQHCKVQVSSCRNRDGMSTIKDALTEKQLKIFQTMYFDQFLHVHNIRFWSTYLSSRLLHAFTSIDWQTLAFIFLEMSNIEFRIPISIMHNRSHTIIWNIYLRWRHEGDDDGNVVKLALLYCLYLGLQRNDTWKLISQKVLQLVDHMDGFNEYP